MNKKLLIIISSILVVTVTSVILAVTVFNKKEPITYNVSFETNGGTKISTQVVNEGEMVVKPSDPIKEGYVFVQWTYQGKTYDFSLPVQSDLVLTAKWEEKIKDVETFVVKFNSDGGTTVPNQIIEKGNKVEKPSNPTKEGYTFVEWQSNGVKYDFETIIENNLELTAVYEIIQVTNKPNTNTNNKPETNGSSNSTSNNSNIVINVSTPTLKENGRGGSSDSFGKSYEVTNIDAADGIEIYKSTNEKEYQLEKTLTKAELSSQKNTIYTNAYIGEHNYYKVRAYKTVNGKKVYSGYSEILEITGPTS